LLAIIFGSSTLRMLGHIGQIVSDDRGVWHAANDRQGSSARDATGVACALIAAKVTMSRTFTRKPSAVAIYG
jgi:hypothetical protein